MASEQQDAQTVHRSMERSGGHRVQHEGASYQLPERDEVYGLVSVLYHSLQGGETYAQYLEDARQAGDEELAAFFEECIIEQNEQARHAKQLLLARLDDEEEEEIDEDELEE
jgi:hypothetical protein